MSGPPRGRKWAEGVAARVARDGWIHPDCSAKPHATIAGDYSTVWLACAACHWQWTLYRDGRPVERAPAPLPGFPGPDPWPRRPALPTSPDVPWEWDACARCGASKRRYEACEACGAPVAAAAVSALSKRGVRLARAAATGRRWRKPPVKKDRF